VLLLRSSKSLKHTHDSVFYYTYYHNVQTSCIVVVVVLMLALRV
jgi:hypothetical protein